MRHDRSPVTFLILVFVLTTPLWLVSRHFTNGALPDNLPLTDAAATFVPMLAAIILVHRESRWSGVKALLARAVDYRRIPSGRWWFSPCY
jgi:hypothetical protein